MTNKPNRPAESSESQRLESLRKRHDALRTRRIEAQTHLRAASETLAKLQEEARSEFGTDDLNELQANLAAMKQDNERKLAEYDQHLTQIESGLSEVEARFANSNAPVGKTS